ncbi:MAG: hypothetical protein U0401_30115 [Anaerolineae bacterium]
MKLTSGCTACRWKKILSSLNGNNWWDAWDQYLPDEQNLVSEWAALKTTPELNDNVIYRVDLGERSGLGDKLPPGLYYLEADFDDAAVYPEAVNANSRLGPERQMLVVSKNNITLKTSNGESLAWGSGFTNRPAGQDYP